MTLSQHPPSASPPPLVIRQADLSLDRDQQAILVLTDQYAQHLMGGGQPLRPDVRKRLIQGLRNHPMVLVFLAWSGEEPVGLATCFVGFSTFEAKPLLNIHDLAVVGPRQGQGIGKRLLETAIDYAKRHDFCALTLEVRTDNARARSLYHRVGFRTVGETLGDETMLFGKLKLTPST